MDAERFGRALGVGVRETARALARAADAAAAPNPRPNSKPNSKLTQSVREPGNTIAGLKRGGRKFGESVWRPAARAGGVLWFELTGVFFGLFALAAGLEVWRHRTEMAAGNGKVWVAVAMFVGFGWFAVSSFLRARARGRRI